MSPFKIYRIVEILDTQITAASTTSNKSSAAHGLKTGIRTYLTAEYALLAAFFILVITRVPKS